MQVLILVVQNTSSFADLGVATSGVTFFRTIGSSFGAAIFGSLFANFLAGRIGPALAAGGAPPRAARVTAGAARAARRRWPRRSSTPMPTRWAWSSCARCPSRSSASSCRSSSRRCRCARWRRSSATDLGEGFGMPSTESPDKILEVAVGRLFRDSPEIRLRSLARQPGCELDVAQTVGAAADLPAEPGVRVGDARPISPNGCGCPTRSSSPPSTALVARRATRCGPATGCGSPRPGRKQVDAMSAAHRRPHRRQAGHSHRRSRGARTGSQVEAALERIAHRMLVQRDWTTTAPDSATAG